MSPMNAPAMGLSGITISDAARSIVEEGISILGGSPSQAVALARQAADIAARDGDDLTLARAHLLCGMGLRRLGDLVTAHELLDTAESIFQSIGDTYYLPSLWQARAAIFNAAGKLEESLTLLARALPMARAASDIVTVQRILTTWAVTMIRQGNYAEAMQSLEEALRSLDENPSPGLKTVVLNAIGSIYQRSNNFERALDFFQQALAIAREIGNLGGNESRNHCSSLICIADTLLYLKRYAEIPPYLDEALAMSRTHELLDVQASVMKGFGDREFALGLFADAIPHFTSAKELLEATGNRMILMNVLHELSSCYAQLQRYDEARDILVNALSIAKAVQSPQLEYTTHRRLAELYFMTNDSLKAAEHYRTALETHERLFSESNQKVLRDTEKRIAIETARRETQMIEQHAAEIGRSRDALKSLNDRQVEILHIVSHDMRNPLGAIVGMAGELSREGTLTLEDARVIAHMIESSGQKLVLLTDQLLLAAQLETGAAHFERSEASLEDVVDRSLKLIRPHAVTKQVTLESTNEGSSGKIQMDVEVVSHILNNLLSNAVKFTESGGTIDVGYLVDDSHLVLSVRDSGIGIPAPLIQTLFDPFNPDKRPGTRNEKGTGLGLPLVKRLVDMEGGSISVVSTVDRGTEIVVKLPLE
jgi:two-component system sensor histidine kinase/response regulator